jgi:hypothetical protein
MSSCPISFHLIHSKITQICRFHSFDWTANAHKGTSKLPCTEIGDKLLTYIYGPTNSPFLTSSCQCLKLAWKWLYSHTKLMFSYMLRIFKLEKKLIIRIRLFSRCIYWYKWTEVQAWNYCLLLIYVTCEILPDDSFQLV